LQASFDDKDNNKKVKQFYEFMLEFDKALVAAAKRYRKDWFRKELTPEQILAYYTPSVKPPKDEKYAPMMKFKIPTKSSNVTDRKEPIAVTIDHSDIYIIRNLDECILL
jgi:hypothetical protein